jgi:hypothetical protein
MALIGIEGFDHYRNGDPFPFDGGAISSVQITTNTRFNYGQAAVSGGGLDWALTANPVTVIQGVAVKMTSTNRWDLFRIYDGASVQAMLEMDQDNRRINVYRGSGTTLLGSTANLILPLLNEWSYVEWKITISDTVGTIIVRVNDVEVLNLSGMDTQATANTRATIAEVGVYSAYVIDDYYLCDGSGAAPFNDFLGNCRIYTEFPISNDTVQWTPSTGSNFQNVDDPGDIDGDTTTNTSATVGQKDLFGVTGDVPVGVIVKAVELRTTLRKDDAVARTVRPKLKSGVTEANGATRNMTVGYVQYRDTLPVDPTDSAAWTPAKANALKIGYEVVS